MATSDATVFAVYGQAYHVEDVIKSSSTGNPLTGGLTALAVNIIKDAAAEAAAAGTVTEIGTTGKVQINLTAADMTARTIFYTVTASNPNAVYATGTINTIDLSEPTGHWLLATVKKLEHGIVQGVGYLLNKVKRNVTTGTITYYKLDETTAVGTMVSDTTPVANEVTKGELT